MAGHLCKTTKIGIEWFFFFKKMCFKFPNVQKILGRKLIQVTRWKWHNEQEKNTHFELTIDLVSESVWLADPQLCCRESCRDTGLYDDEKLTLYPWALYKSLHAQNQKSKCWRVGAFGVWGVGVSSVSGMVLDNKKHRIKRTQKIKIKIKSEIIKRLPKRMQNENRKPRTIKLVHWKFTRADEFRAFAFL